MEINAVRSLAFNKDRIVAGKAKPGSELGTANRSRIPTGQRTFSAYHPARHGLCLGAGERTCEKNEPVFLAQRVCVRRLFSVKISDPKTPSSNERIGDLRRNGFHFCSSLRQVDA